MVKHLARLGLCLLLGCARGGPSGAVDKAGPDHDPALIAKICAQDCIGEFSRVTVLRDAKGEVARYRFNGDLAVCSHPPSVYYDAQGNEVATIPEQPVTSDEEAKMFAKRNQDAIAGATEAETLRCP